MDRRDLLRGAGMLGAGLPAAARAAPPAPAAILAAAGGGMPVLATLDAMARATVEPGGLVYLAQPGREGLFRCVAARPPAADPLRGLYVPGEGGDRHFARVWDERTGRPEWFGAVTDDGAVDCAPAIEACVALCPATQLGQRDYFIRRTLVLAHSWRTLYGSGGYATDQGQGTRIILQGSAPGVHTADLLLVGSRGQPSRNNDSFPIEIHLADLTLIRDGASAPHPSGDLRRYPTGLRAAFLTRCSFSRIASLESAVGFYFGGTVYTKADDCMAQRFAAGTGAGQDLAAGFVLDGSPDIGLAGGNASLYLNRCLAVGQHPRHVRPTGLVAEGAFVDSFIDGFESARIDGGMRFSARGAGGPGQTIDLHVRNCVLDACGATALDLDLAGTLAASIEIIDPYIAAGGSGGVAGIAVHDGAGLVTLTGGQVHGDFRDGSLLLRRTRGARAQGLKLHEGSRPVVVEACGMLQLEPQVSNLARATPHFAVTCAGMYRSTVRPMVLGAPGMLGGGVSLDGACDHASVDASAIDPGCFAEATASRKVWFDGADAIGGPGRRAYDQRGNVVNGVTG